MFIQNLAIKQVPLPENFDYQMLYNNNRGGIFKGELQYLINRSIQEELITIKKFILAQDVDEQSLDFKRREGNERYLLYRLTHYNNEQYSVSSSIIFLLKLLDPVFTIDHKDGCLKINSEVFDVSIRPRIDDKNAEPRLFFTQENIAIISTNENITNLTDVLAVKGVTVYAIEYDFLSNNICAYKINRKDCYFELAMNYRKELERNLTDNYNKYI